MRAIRQPRSGGKASYNATADPEIIVRFWSKVQIGDGCWLWSSTLVRGYGQFVLPRLDDGTQPHFYAHRFAWFLEHGALPPSDVKVCHRCDTPACVRPDHLFLGSQQENLTDARQKGRLREWMPRRPLSVDAYREILLTKARGVDLARKFGVTETTIARIRMGIQGARVAQMILQDQAPQPQPRLTPQDVVHQILEPVPFVQVSVSGEIR